MRANPLRDALDNGGPERITAPKDPQERINFWIARGNALLDADGKSHLHWVWLNGSYSIEPRPTRRLTSYSNEVVP